jgi:hypothetical protein
VVPTLAQPTSDEPLFAPGLDLRAGPVEIPLELRIPSILLKAPLLGVGITPKNLMDAPGGVADDPVWQKAFWYRGGALPGDLGTATIAGHVIDRLGRPAVFAALKELGPGDLIIIRDTRSGLDVPFLVTEVESYSIQQSADPSVLARIYGSGPVSGQGPQPTADGLSHLTLITCSGDWVRGAYDRRLVIYAGRVPGRAAWYVTADELAALE